MYVNATAATNKEAIAIRWLVPRYTNAEDVNKIILTTTNCSLNDDRKKKKEQRVTFYSIYFRV